MISDVLSNATFRGRGLTARFLYCMPDSFVGSRKHKSNPIPDEAYRRYELLLTNLLDDEYPDKPDTITLSGEADSLLTAFAEEVEPKLIKEYAELADWAGKLVGNTLRIAGLLCRAEMYIGHDFLETPPPLVVQGSTMEKAISLGRFFLSHAQAAFSALPEDAMTANAGKILKMIAERGLKEFDRRTAMRFCRTFKTVAEIQPVLDFLEDYGYIAAQPSKASGNGRPPLPRYTVNPLTDFCPFVTVSSQP